MADAGKIVITPKGAYSSTATYEWLDEVTYDGKAYIALKTVTGVTPSDDGVNWRLFLDPNDIVAGNLVPTFTEASTRSNIISEENLSTILGKVKKYFTDLKGHAFNDTVKNLTTENIGSALDASQGKILKDEVDNVNDSLADYGLNKANSIFENGTMLSGSGEKLNANNRIRNVDFLKATNTARIIIKNAKSDYQWTYVYFFNNGTYVTDINLGKITDKTVTIPSNANQVKFVVSCSDNFTPNDFDIDIYCDNAIDELKNDLDKLNSLPKGSIIQIEADKDDTKTTTQKYGWQYLGTSNIQYENGSSNLLVTNVYRKNN